MWLLLVLHHLKTFIQPDNRYHSSSGIEHYVCSSVELVGDISPLFLQIYVETTRRKTFWGCMGVEKFGIESKLHIVCAKITIAWWRASAVSVGSDERTTRGFAKLTEKYKKTSTFVQKDSNFKCLWFQSSYIKDILLSQKSNINTNLSTRVRVTFETNIAVWSCSHLATYQNFTSLT